MKKMIVFILVMLSLSVQVQAKKFKCWTNSDGVRECGNSLPPQYVKQRVEFYNEKSGRVTKVVGAAKTKAQILAEKEHSKQQKKRDREQRKQKNYDNVLLKTYLSIDDLLLSLHWKITTLDSRVKVSKTALIAENKKFLKYSRQVAQSERSGSKIPKRLVAQVLDSRKKIKNLEQRVIYTKQEKKDIHTKFSHDVNRFVIARVNGLTLKDDEKSRSLNMVQISCNNKPECNNKWFSAKGFIKKQTKLKIIFDTDTVYTTVSPQQSKELAYTVSRSHSKSNGIKTEKITLKVRCKPSRVGEQLCKNQQVTDLLNTFKNTITAVK